MDSIMVRAIAVAAASSFLFAQSDILPDHKHALGENVGWINLDGDAQFIAFYCPSDFHHDLLVNTLDVLAFLAAWAADC